MWLLDTNAVSRYLGGRDLLLKKRFDTTPLRHLVLCSIVKAELLYGAYYSPDPAFTLARLSWILSSLASFDFDDPAAEEYGKIQAHLSRAGTRIGPNDTMIAAIALANDLTLVTHNTSEFSRVPGLKLEDWQI